MRAPGLPLSISLLFTARLLTAQPEKWFERLEFRNIGPAIMGGRATDIEGVPGQPGLIYAATGSGGLWKTTNGGVSWKALFERERVYSIGDIALEPKNPNVIWLGSGESNVRNSVSFGGGVYLSTDGGTTWQLKGLESTERISRLAINPLDPRKVYVGALGHAFGPSEHRGVYMTADGGTTWQKTLYLDPQHGVSDLDIDPQNPNILYAALWKFERKPWTHTSGSEQGGVWKSIDGGLTWTKLTKGLPKLIGRIGVKVAPSKPNIIYVICESNEGILYRSDDHGETFTAVNKNREIVGRGFYYADLRVDPVDENRVYALSSNLHLSIDGGRTFRIISRRTHLDFHALWIDPQDPNRIWQGQDGGFAASYDRGDTWEYVNNIPLAQFYQLHADNRLPFYNVMGGLQDNGSWTGPSRTKEPAGILNDDWRMVSFGDGFFVVNHPDDPDLYLTESQGGALSRMDMRNREQQASSPQPKSNAGGAAGEMKYRFNWNTPIVPSPHNKDTVYFGGNVLFRSQDFGKTWRPISPDLTNADPAKLKSAGGPIWYDNSTAENYATVVTVSESPLRSGTILAGTDDGNVQLTVNGGESWSNLIKNFPGLPPTPVVSHVEASRYDVNTAYVAFDRHMFDDFRPYVYRSTDGGKSWQSIAGNLPEAGYVHVVKEDPKNRNLIYCGTELGLFASWNGGQSWSRLHLKNLPHVPVHEIIVHPRENDLILATHGRSVYILDDATPIQQMSAERAARAAELFEIRPAMRFTTRMSRYGIGNKVYAGPNPPYGALISFWLKDKPGEKTSWKLEIVDNATQKVIRELRNLPKEAGLHRISWDLRSAGPAPRKEASAAGSAAGDDDDFNPAPRGPQVVPGVYTVRLTLGELVLTKPIEVRLDPTVSTPAADLVSQRTTLTRIHELQGSVNQQLATIDLLRDQLEQTEKLAKSLGVAMPKDLAAWRKAIDEAEGLFAKPANVPRLESGPRLSEKLSGLFNGIDGVNAAPTAYQLEVLKELEADYTKALAAGKQLAAEAPRWSEALRQASLPGLLLRK